MVRAFVKFELQRGACLLCASVIERVFFISLTETNMWLRVDFECCNPTLTWKEYCLVASYKLAGGCACSWSAAIPLWREKSTVQRYQINTQVVARGLWVLQYHYDIERVLRSGLIEMDMWLEVEFEYYALVRIADHSLERACHELGRTYLQEQQCCVAHEFQRSFS